MGYSKHTNCSSIYVSIYQSQCTYPVSFTAYISGEPSTSHGVQLSSAVHSMAEGWDV